jgi:hypothetical protein
MANHQQLRFTENETGMHVLVSTYFVWGDEGMRLHAVQYPSGRTFVVNDALLALHFTIESPQEVFITAFGGDDRPLAAQRAREVQQG